MRGRRQTAKKSCEGLCVAVATMPTMHGKRVTGDTTASAVAAPGGPGAKYWKDASDQLLIYSHALPKKGSF